MNPAHPDYHSRLKQGGQIVFDPMTALLVVAGGLQVAKAHSEAQAANKQAKASIAEGNIVAANKAKEVARNAAAQRVSFLNSGLTLEGTPMNVIESTFNTGTEDINQIRNNYNARAKSQIAAGRSAAIGDLANAFAFAAMPSMPGFSEVSNTAGNFFDGFGAGFNNAEIVQTGGMPGFSSSYGPIWQGQPLPWRS
jgi:hypothetical protein